MRWSLLTFLLFCFAAKGQVVDKSILIEGVVRNAVTYEVLEVELTIYKDSIQNPTIIKCSETGQFSFYIDTTSVYDIGITVKGFFPFRHQIIYGVFSDGLSRNNYIIDLMPLDRCTLRIPMVMFDKKTGAMAEDGLSEINGIIKNIKDNPQIKLVEIRGRTDSRGNKIANKRLTKKWCKYVAAIMVSKGINRKRLKLAPMGEKELLNQCSDGVICDDEEHDINNHVVYKILK